MRCKTGTAQVSYAEMVYIRQFTHVVGGVFYLTQELVQNNENVLEFLVFIMLCVKIINN